MWSNAAVTDDASRAELADFLRTRRAAVQPADVGLPAAGRRRTPGLRREEVAILAGVSVSWYTWLEQGRPINASTQVLDALAAVLRLDDAQRDHLMRLAGRHVRHHGSPRGGDVPEWAERMLSSVDPAPAYLLGPTWEYLAWNDAQAALFPPMLDLPDGERNLVWVMFAVPETRTFVADWEHEARHVLSQFRADVTPWRDEPDVVDLVARLRAASPEFDEWWDRHDVAGFETRLRRFHHPTRGTLTFEYQQLIPAGRSDLRFVVQLPVSDTPSDESEGNGE